MKLPRMNTAMSARTKLPQTDPSSLEGLGHVMSTGASSKQAHAPCASIKDVQTNKQCFRSSHFLPSAFPPNHNQPYIFLSPRYTGPDPCSLLLTVESVFYLLLCSLLRQSASLFFSSFIFSSSVSQHTSLV
jgi:hypothetical protein